MAIVQFRQNRGMMANLYLVDIENLCKTGIPTTKEILIARALLIHRTKGDPEKDFFVVGTHVGGAANIKKAWPKVDKNGRTNWVGSFRRSGLDQHDAADNAITHWMSRNSDTLSQWERVVIGSGDHHFIPLARQLLRQGKKVSIVSLRRSSMHHDWREVKRASLNYLTDLNADFFHGFRKFQLDQILAEIASGKYKQAKLKKSETAKKGTAKHSDSNKDKGGPKGKPQEITSTNLATLFMVQTSKRIYRIHTWDMPPSFVGENQIYLNANSDIIADLRNAKIGDNLDFQVLGTRIIGKLNFHGGMPKPKKNTRKATRQNIKPDSVLQKSSHLTHIQLSDIIKETKYDYSVIVDSCQKLVMRTNRYPNVEAVFNKVIEHYENGGITKVNLFIEKVLFDL